MFDIPVATTEGKKMYTQFRKMSLNDGFLMLQFSVYSRYCHNYTDCEKHILRLKKFKPTCGDIRILKLTECQYQQMIILIGEKHFDETLQYDNDVIIIE